MKIHEKKQKTISEIVSDVAELMCNKYCKYPNMYEDEDKLIEEQCENCPLVNML